MLGWFVIYVPNFQFKLNSNTNHTPRLDVHMEVHSKSLKFNFVYGSEHGSMVPELQVTGLSVGGMWPVVLQQVLSSHFLMNRSFTLTPEPGRSVPQFKSFRVASCFFGSKTGFLQVLLVIYVSFMRNYDGIFQLLNNRRKSSLMTMNTHALN